MAPPFVPDSRVLLLDTGAVVLRGRTVTPALPSWPAKDPGEVLGHAANFAALTGGQPIVQLDVAVQPPGAALVVSAAATGTMAILLLGGGTDGQPATLVLTATLPDGERLVRAVLLPMLAQAAPAAALDPLAVSLNGFALTYAGAPIKVQP